jgi:hypothetical protein
MVQQKRTYSLDPLYAIPRSMKYVVGMRLWVSAMPIFESG